MRHLTAVLLVIAAVGMSPGGMHAQVAGATSTGPSQAADAAGPAFEVVSLKIDRDSPFGNASPLGQNRWTVTQANLIRLVGLAFDVPYQEMVGLPDWGGPERYAVAAKAEDGVLLTTEGLAARLRTFLAERFKLVTHRETQMRKGYALVVAKGGSKMKAAKDGPPLMSALRPDSLRARSVEMDTMARILGHAPGLVGQPVVNETGLTGTYEFTLTFAPVMSTVFGMPFTAPSTDSNLPSVFTALEEQLGLKLEPRTVPVEMLMIDHVERPVLD